MKHFIVSLLLTTEVFAAIPLGVMNTYDHEAKEWRDQVRTNSSDVLGASYRDATTFMQFVRTRGIRPKLILVMPYLGTNLNGCLMPIVHTIPNTGGPLLNQNFDEADYSEATGLTGNGSDEYIQMQGAGSGVVSMTDIGMKAHLAVYVRTGANAAQHCIGAIWTATDSSAYMLVSNSDARTYGQMNDTVSLQWSAADSAGTGFYVCTRTTTTFAAVYKNGLQQSSQTGTVVGDHFGSTVIFVHAVNVDGLPIAHTTRTISFASAGYELTAQQNLDYYRAVQRLQLGRGRAVP